MKPSKMRKADHLRYEKLMRYPKRWLVFLCIEYDLYEYGTKEALAARVAIHENTRKKVG